MNDVPRQVKERSRLDVAWRRAGRCCGDVWTSVPERGTKRVGMQGIGERVGA